MANLFLHKELEKMTTFSRGFSSLKKTAFKPYQFFIFACVFVN